jgi:hypothetical protein
VSWYRLNGPSITGAITKRSIYFHGECHDLEASRDIAGVDDVSVGEDWSIQFLGTD